MSYAKEGEKETSCGGVVIYDKKILFVKSKKFQFWNLPKGHLEENETELECALREIEEETGLTSLKQIGEFKESITYKNQLFKTIKTTVLFLFQADTNKISLDEDNEDYQWALVDDAKNIIENISSKPIILKAIEFAKRTGDL